MAKNILLNPGRLLKTSGLGALAAALALMTLPADVFAQDGGRGRWGGQSAQSQSSGAGNSGRSWGGNRGSDSGGRSWGGNRGGDSGGGGWRSRGGDGGGSGWRGRSADGNGGSWRNRSGESSVRSWGGNGGGNSGWRNRSADGQRSVGSQGGWSRRGWNGNNQRWGNQGDVTNGAAQRAAQARAARMAEIQRRSEAGSNQQWSGRNRSYSDPDRNRGYRQGWRDGRGSDNWQNRQQRREAYRDGWRDNNRQDRWRNNNNNNRWDNSRWDNDGRRSNRWGNNDRRWNHDWRRDHRYDWHRYRDHNRHVFRLGRYYAPYRNYSYRRLGVGFYLDSLFFGSRYWIDDPWYYRLPPAHGPYRWIRYYDDALLVNTYTGEVVDVIHDFFW